MKKTLLLLVLCLAGGLGCAGRRSALESEPAGWIDLMPGKDLLGWRRVPIDPLAEKPVWTLSADGTTLLIDGVNAKELLLEYTERGDGIFHVEWRFRKLEVPNPVYNGGVYVRTSPSGQTWVQAQVAHADKPPVVGDLFGITFVKGKLQRTEVLQKGSNRSNPPGEWNTFEVTCRGPQVSLWVNGAATAVWENCGLLRGHLGLQAEFAFVEVRSLKFKPLDG